MITVVILMSDILRIEVESNQEQKSMTRKWIEVNFEVTMIMEIMRQIKRERQEK